MEAAGAFLRALQSVGVVGANGRGGLVARMLRPRFSRCAHRCAWKTAILWYEAYPAPGLTLDVTIDFPHPLIGRQRCTVDVLPETFARELADARTFGFTDELDGLREAGLIKGGSVENAIVLDSQGGIVEGVGELRWPDEFVRHKTMDCVGDLALAGGACSRPHRCAPSEPSRDDQARAGELLTSGEQGDVVCSASKTS